MPKIFLSYAEEDAVFAQQVKGFLISELGWQIADWMDRSQRGQQWINKIEKDINDANAFLALISPHYLTSPWCIHERNMALRKDVDFQKAGKQYLWIGEVLKTEKIGISANYDWLNLAGPKWEDILRDLCVRLKQNEHSGALPLASEKEAIVRPTFQNRQEELDDLIGNLTNVSGKHFWLLLSAPQMGKSWLLDRLPTELTDKDSSWQVVRIDLREQRSDACSNLTNLLSLFFKQKFRKPINSSQITTFAKKLAKENTRMLWILDSAELLSDETAKALRESLSNIYDLLEKSPKRDVRFAFIAASRRQIPSWRSVIPTPRFVSRTLSHFSIGVIEKFLRDMAEKDKCDRDKRWFRDKSQQLAKASEGLPGLLVNYMEWIQDNGYILDPGIRSQALFTTLATPYAANHLLSAHSLLPSRPDSNLIEPRRALLERTLLGLSSYRCFTEKYLHKLIEENHGLTAELRQADWGLKDLWDALRNTYLVEPSPDIMRKLYPAVRRLLFRYKYSTRIKQVEAHQGAIDFYDKTQMDLVGTDKAIILIERLWHQAEYQRLANPNPGLTSLFVFAWDLFKNGIQPNHHTDRDLAVLIDERLNNDTELQESLAEIDRNLFGDIVSTVNEFIS